MVEQVMKWLGYRVEYVCEWGTYSRQYDSIDHAMTRPIYLQMSVAPPWAKRRFTQA